jgi:hypothetical protein
MAIIVQQTPKEYNQAGQTIPFVVTSDIFELIQDFDIVQQSFKYVFEVKTLRDDGIYKSFAKVAIAPRPDNFVGYFDASSIIQSAITYNNLAHKENTAVIQDKSVVQFMVICTERYLDTNNEYVSNTPEVLGSFFAINSKVENPIEDYLMMETTGTTKPLHQYEILDNVNVQPKEPFSLSWLAKAQIGGNLLNNTNGDFGTFDFGTLTTYTDLTINSTFIQDSRFISGSFSLGDGRALQTNVKSNAFLDTDTGGTILTFEDVTLQSGKNYVAGGWVRISQPVPFSTPDNSPLIFFQVSIAGVTTILNFPIAANLTKAQFLPFSLSFSVASTNNYDIKVELIRDPAALIGLDIYNNRRLYFDNFGVFELFDDGKTIDDINIVVNRGLSSEVTHSVPSAYLTTISALNTIGSARFETPLNGVDILNDNTKQDQTTFLFKDDNGDVGKYYEVEIINSADVVGLSNKIFQKHVCTEYDNYRLKWLNDLGGWDYYTFNKVTNAQTNYDRDVYKVEPGEFFEITNNVINYQDKTDAGYTMLMTNQVDQLTFNTDWLSKEEIQWFKGLLSSRRVFVLNPEKLRINPETNEYDEEYPLIINNAEYLYATNNKGSKLSSLTINATLSRQFNDKTTNII